MSKKRAQQAYIRNRENRALTETIRDVGIRSCSKDPKTEAENRERKYGKFEVQESGELIEW